MLFKKSKEKELIKLFNLMLLFDHLPKTSQLFRMEISSMANERSSFFPFVEYSSTLLLRNLNERALNPGEASIFEHHRLIVDVLGRALPNVFRTNLYAEALLRCKLKAKILMDSSNL